MKKTLIALAILIVAALALIKANAAVNTDVYLAIMGNNVTIGATGSFDFGTATISDMDNPVAKQFTGDDYFWLKDLKGADSGYYTTIQTTDLTGVNGTISGGNVAMKVDTTAVGVINGTTNSRVLVNSSLLSYVSLATPVTFIYRDPAANAGIIGKYATYPRLQVTIPAYQPVGSYHGTLTYTLYEN